MQLKISNWSIFDKVKGQSSPLVKKPFSDFWLTLWALVLALGWLLPNHYVPWIAFHFDAWIASCFALAACVVVIRSEKFYHVHRFTLIAGFTLLIPPAQYAFELLQFSGQAWISFAFLFGFFIVLLLGSHWESISSNQAIDGLFLAIGIAGIISVGLQLFQWLQLSMNSMDLWIMSVSGNRPFANFVQPNQLATFLIWSLLGGAWGVARGKISHRIAMFLSVYLLFGIALTQSRTAFIAIVGLVGACFLWRKLWPSKTIKNSIFALGITYLFFVWFIPVVASAIGADEGLNMVARSGNEIRLSVYKLFLDAAMQKPIWGYGWAQTATAQLAVAENHPSLGSMFLQAHNLLVDLVIWCGIPLGGLISATLVWWFVDKARRVETPQNAILVMFVAVVGWHAMLELPLHYAYMLFPTGLVMGVLNARLKEPVLAQWPRWVFVIILTLAIALLSGITRDYLRIEDSFRILRFERARIGAKISNPMENVLLLNQMNEFIEIGRTPARKDMTIEELDRMRRAANAFPSLSNLFTLAQSLAWNNETEAAQILVNKLSKVTTISELNNMKNIWNNLSLSDDLLRKIYWPNG